MSAEFERIVLEKFDDLSSKINELSVEMHEVKEKIEHNSILINNLSKKVENNSILINNLSEKVDQQGLNFARFENEFTIKIQALFDSFVANTESHLSYEKSIATLHAKTFHHDNRISVLEDYFKDAKLLANN